MSIRTLVDTVEHTEALSVPARARTIPHVLSIAGTDPTGGAGLQADLKSIGAQGGYGMAVVTSLVAQNTRGVRSVHTPPSTFLDEQLQPECSETRKPSAQSGDGCRERPGPS